MLHICYIFPTYLLHIGNMHFLREHKSCIFPFMSSTLILQIPFGFGTDQLCSHVGASRRVGIFDQVVLFDQEDALDKAAQLTMWVCFTRLIWSRKGLVAWPGGFHSPAEVTWSRELSPTSIATWLYCSSNLSRYAWSGSAHCKSLLLATSWHES